MATHLKYIFFVLFFSLCSHAANAATSEEIIDGFSEFLIDRANSNLIAVFERRLKNDKNFQCYFPNTYEKIDTISLENLFASKDYWESGLETDLEVLVYRSILVEAQQVLKFIDRNKIIRAMQYFEYEYEGKRYPINELGLDWPKPLVDQVNGFSYSLAESLNVLDDQVIYANVCQVKGKNRDELKESIQPYLETGKNLVVWSNHVAEYGKNLRLSDAGKKALFCDPENIPEADCAATKFDESTLLKRLLDTNNPEKAKKAVSIANRIEQAYAALEALDKRQLDSIDLAVTLMPLLENPNFQSADIQAAQQTLQQAKDSDKDKRKELMVSVVATIKQKVSSDDTDAAHIISMLQVFIEDKQSYTERALVALELLEGSDIFNSSGYERLSKSVMFFASVADAEDKEAVKNTLVAYTMPPVSYSEKRKFGTGYFISSYFGFVAANSNMHDSAEEPSNGGLFVPVGLEFNYGFAFGGSLSLMLSPIDMAYPINLKLSGINDKVEFDEIVAPSATLAYGFKDYPLNVGVGYQRGRTLADVSKTEELILFFVSFDMPLFRLY